MTTDAEWLGLENWPQDIQAEVKAWHAGKYPHASLPEIGLKLAEESGEVCRAIDRFHYAKNGVDEAAWANNLKEEIGDVAIVLLVLCIRGGVDFQEVVQERWDEVSSR